MFDCKISNQQPKGYRGTSLTGPVTQRLLVDNSYADYISFLTNRLLINIACEALNMPCFIAPEPVSIYYFISTLMEIISPFSLLTLQ